MKLWIYSVCLLVLLGISGCRSTVPEGYLSSEELRKKYPDTPWTATELENSLAGDDPAEGFNRAMFSVTDFCMRYMAKPIGWVYCTIFPRPVIEMIDRACNNLEYPARVFSCLGCGEWLAARDETARFFINTTLGIGGLFDPAGNWWQFYGTEFDFGQMFARWGFKPGCTLVLPLCPRFNVRDLVGFLFDVAFDGKTYIPFCGWATGLNRVVVAYRTYHGALDGAADTYKNFRQLVVAKRLIDRELRVWKLRNEVSNAYLAYHAKTVEPVTWKAMPPVSKPAGCVNYEPLDNYMSQGPMLNTLRNPYFNLQKNDHYWYLRLSLFNRDFPKWVDNNTVCMGTDRPDSHYLYKEAPEADKSAPPQPERLMIVIPGIGALAEGDPTMAMAEIFHNRGWKTVMIDDLFCWRSMKEAGNWQLPGYLPRDTANLRRQIGKILSDLKQRGKIKSPQIAMIGWSFGGLYTLHLAAMENQKNTLGINRFIAINPPADLAYAVEVCDRLEKSMAKKSREEILNQATTLGTILLSRYGSPAPRPIQLRKKPAVFPFAYQIPVTVDQARIASAISFRLSLRELLFTAHAHQPLPGLKWSSRMPDRNYLYEEIDRISFKRYVTDFLMVQAGLTCYDDLAQAANLRSIAGVLKYDPKIRVLHNLDDFLLNNQDRRFLTDTLGRKIIWFGSGGHLGNLYHETVRQWVINAAEKP